MNIKVVVAFGAITALALYNEVACRINGDTIDRQKDVIKSLVETNTYLSAKLDEAQVPITEFDRIAMKNF